MTPYNIPEKMISLLPVKEDLYAESGAAAVRAFGGRVINYIFNAGDGDAHHLTVINGRVVESYEIWTWNGQSRRTDTQLHLGTWAWGAGLRSNYGYEIASSMKLYDWMETLDPKHPDHAKFH